MIALSRNGEGGQNKKMDMIRYEYLFEDMQERIVTSARELAPQVSYIHAWCLQRQYVVVIMSES
jgi:hypothetical protein